MRMELGSLTEVILPSVRCRGADCFMGRKSLTITCFLTSDHLFYLQLGLLYFFVGELF